MTDIKAAKSMQPTDQEIQEWVDTCPCVPLEEEIQGKATWQYYLDRIELYHLIKEALVRFG